MSIRRSDFALVAAACQLALDGDGVCRRIALGIGGAEAMPVRATEAERALVGTRLEAGDVDRATAALGAALAPLSDHHASADYRRRVATALAARAVASARGEALGARH
jgi:CO/xanthine dehydrogenase FAD-binding subunit